MFSWVYCGYCGRMVLFKTGSWTLWNMWSSQMHSLWMQEVVIMSNACDTCGYRSSDIKAGGGISDKGKAIILNVAEPEDLRRDVIKADTAYISIPEADLEVTTGR